MIDTVEKRKPPLTEAQFLEAQRRGVPVIDREADKRGPAIERPTAERMAKGGVIQSDQSRGDKPKPWYARECLIDVYAGDGTITKRQAMAGYNFRSLWYTAHGSDVKSQAFQPRVSGGVEEFTDRREAAIEQLKLLAEKYGRDIFNCLRAIVGQGETWSHWARARGEWPSSGKLALRMSLNRHADHLKLPDDEDSAARA